MTGQVDRGLAAIGQSAGDEEERQRRRIDRRVGLRRTARLGDIGRLADVAVIDGREAAGEGERGERRKERGGEFVHGVGRQSGVEGKRVLVRVDLGGRRITKKKKKKENK